MIQAGQQHAAALAALHAVTFPQEPWSETSFRTLLRQPGMAGFIDPRGGMILTRRVVDEAEIITIGAAVKRQGIGTRLLQTAIADLTAHNVTTLHLEVAASNIPARFLYTAFGFKQTGQRANYYPDGGDALILSLKLPRAGA